MEIFQKNVKFSGQFFRLTPLTDSTSQSQTTASDITICQSS